MRSVSLLLHSRHSYVPTPVFTADPCQSKHTSRILSRSSPCVPKGPRPSLRHPFLCAVLTRAAPSTTSSHSNSPARIVLVNYFASGGTIGADAPSPRSQLSCHARTQQPSVPLAPLLFYSVAHHHLSRALTRRMRTHPHTPDNELFPFPRQCALASTH